MDFEKEINMKKITISKHTTVKIYALFDPMTCEIRYIGQTVASLSDRLRIHIRDKHVSHKQRWISKLRQKGYTPTIECVQELPIEAWSEAERYWISYFKQLGCPLTNETKGGEGMLGCSPSIETRAKIREAAKKQFENPQMRESVSRVHKGKSISKEHKKTIGQAAKLKWEIWRASGCQISEETREKIRTSKIGKTGHKASDETREKQREARLAYWERNKGPFGRT